MYYLFVRFKWWFIFHIFSRDLLTICRQLNLEDSVDDLMKELGADKTGRISFDEFVRRRLELRTEINALQVRNYDPLPEYLPTSSDNSLGKIYKSLFDKIVCIFFKCMYLF